MPPTQPVATGKEVRDILEQSCTNRELLFLVTPYLRYESNFVHLEEDACHIRISMSVEDAMYGLRSTDLRIRFPHATRFLEGKTKMLGFGLHGGRRTIRLALPTALHDDELRKSYRVERVGRVEVTFSTPRFDIYSGSLVNISVNGARIQCPNDYLNQLFQLGDPCVLTIPLTDEIRINAPAVIRWLQPHSAGVEFNPPLSGVLQTALTRWIFQKREEDKDLAVRSTTAHPAATRREGSGGLLLVSHSAELEEALHPLLEGLPPMKRVPPILQPLKEALADEPALLLFHLPGGNLDERRRLRPLAEFVSNRVPFVLLGTNMDSGPLFELATELKAVSAYVVGPKPGAFFHRLVQGILRRKEHPEPPARPE